MEQLFVVGPIDLPPKIISGFFIEIYPPSIN